MNTTTTTFIEAPEVVFVYREEPTEDKVNPIQNSYWHKPLGGIWTCPAWTRDNWANWCEAEMPDWLDGTRTYHLTPRPGTRVAVIDTLDDLKTLLHTYSIEGVLGKPVLDFEAMARDFDGIWLTEEGQWRTRLTEPSLYGWDLETVLFFRWVFE